MKIEFDGTNYQTESNPQTQDSKLNFGFVYPVTRGLMLKLSSTRGNTINFGFSYSLDVGSKNPRKISMNKKTKLDNTKIIQKVTDRSDENLYKASLLYLKRQGISLQKASIEENKLHVVYSQNKFRSPAMAAGRTIRTLDEVAPDSISTLKVSEVNAGMGMHSVELDRSVINRYADLGIPKAIDGYVTTEGYKFNENEYEFNPSVTYPVAFHSLGPDLQTQIGGPDGFFFGDFKLRYDSEILFSRRLSLVSAASYGLYDNMGPLKLNSDSILPHVRTDIVDYLKESRGFSIKRLQLNFYGQPSKSIFYKLSGGIFESMFNGIGGELLFRPYDKNYGVGLEMWGL